MQRCRAPPISRTTPFLRIIASKGARRHHEIRRGIVAPIWAHHGRPHFVLSRTIDARPSARLYRGVSRSASTPGSKTRAAKLRRLCACDPAGACQASVGERRACRKFFPDPTFPRWSSGGFVISTFVTAGFPSSRHCDARPLADGEAMTSRSLYFGCLGSPQQNYTDRAIVEASIEYPQGRPISRACLRAVSCVGRTATPRARTR